MNTNLIKATASSLVLGISLMGCTQSANLFRPRTLSAANTPNDRQAVKAHENAQKAMMKGDPASATSAMEQAVELSPHDVGYRKTLAELYMRAGRFVSAETTYSDVVKLNPGDAKAAFFVAICQLAQGRTAAALAELGAMDTSIDAADLGLAYALAGDTRRAIYLLEPAARSVTANGRVRQNLALAYALAGDWKRARLTAELDVSPAVLNKRLQEWASLASVGAPETRVAMMFGVSPAADPGQPTRLALVPAAPATDASAELTTPAAPESAAVAEAQPVVSVPTEPVQTVAAPVVPVSAASVADVASVAAPTPVVSATPGFTPAAQPAPTLRASAPVTPAALPVARAQMRKASSGQFVVQIGAFNSPAQVEQAWAEQVRRYAFIAQFEPLSTSVRIAGKGLFYRLAIAGFDSQAAAANACRAIKAKGGACFVRANAGDAPVQWASRYSRKV